MSNLFLMLEGGAKPACVDFDEDWTIDKCLSMLDMKIISYDKSDIEFDIIGFFPAMANAIRRILLAELPSMAIEKMTVIENTTILSDETLALRFGLIPLRANPKYFQFREPGDEYGTDRDTLNFELKVKCEKNPLQRAGHYKAEDLYINNLLHSKEIKWVPFGDQGVLYKEEEIGPVHDDIMIGKMIPKQELHVKLTAMKGIGKDHAKFSPVSVAFYRLHPYIELLEEITNEDADRVKNCFSEGVIEVINIKGKRVAQVKNERIDSSSRNILSEPDLKDKVVIGRKRDHYIFTIESTNSTPPDELFRDAVQLLKKKCSEAILSLQSLIAKEN